jgi:AcrR family transcriptional regulator
VNYGCHSETEMPTAFGRTIALNQLKEYHVSLSSFVDVPVTGSIALRNEPVQARSTARLAALLDAAAAVIDEHGYELLTTAMVAERAGASIGTVYRYFPDRIAVLQALAQRNLDRVLVSVTAEVTSGSHSTWASAVTAGLAHYVDAFRTEPGFRGLRVGDVIDLRPATGATKNSIVADAIREAVVSRFGVVNDDRTKFLFECAVETTDALAARAFHSSAAGEKSFLDASADVVSHLLTPHLGK